MRKFLLISLLSTLLLAAPGMGKAVEKLKVTIDVIGFEAKSVEIDFVKGSPPCPDKIKNWNEKIGCGAWNWFAPEIIDDHGTLKVKALGREYTLGETKEYKDPVTGLVTLATIKIELLGAGMLEIKNPLEADTFQELIERLIDFVFVISVAVAPLMLLVAGFLFLTAGGAPDKIGRAKAMILWTIIGFAVVILAKGMIAVVEQILGG